MNDFNKMKTMKLYQFKTDITSHKKAQNLSLLLTNYFNISFVEFDFSKMKSLLRIESSNLSPSKVKTTLNDFGYSCEEI